MNTATEPARLDARTLNRTLLARQLLLARAPLTAIAAVEHLVGLQAQAIEPPYLALWSRIDGFQLDDLSRALIERRVVRIALMRSTIHLVTAGDCLALRPVLQAALERHLGASQYGRRLKGIDGAALAAATRALLEAEPRTTADLGQRLRRRWRGRDAEALAYAARALVPLVQLPPRGVWRQGGPPRCATAEAWLGQPLATDRAPDATVLRYLAAFGPASAADVQVWSGLPPAAARDALQRLRPRLRPLRDAAGRELLDLPDAALSAPDTPAPPRLLPEYDNVMLSHADRSRIVPDRHRRRIAAANGVRRTFLIDGFVAGTWTVTRPPPRASAGAAVTLALAPFERLSRADRAALHDEAERLLALVAAGAGRRTVRFIAPA